MQHITQQRSIADMIRNAFGLPDTPPKTTRDLRGYSAGRIAEKRQRRSRSIVRSAAGAASYPESHWRPAHVIAIALHETTGEWVLVQKGTENAGVQKKARLMHRTKLDGYVTSLKVNGYKVTQKDFWIIARLEF